MSKTDDTQPANSYRADIRVPVFAVIGLVLSLSGIIYGQLLALDQKLERRFENHNDRCANRYTEFERRLDDLARNKADHNAASDRYTGKQANERRRAVDQRFDQAEKANAFAHEAIQRQIDHIHDMINRGDLTCPKP